MSSNNRNGQHQQQSPGYNWKQELFDYLLNELDVIALESQLQDIQRIVLKGLEQEESCTPEELEDEFTDFLYNNII